MADKILRHPIAVRLIHWTVALSGLILLFSGFGQLPMYKRYNIIKIPGLSWANNFETTLVIHIIAAIFFSAAVVFHIVFHLRRKEYAAWPKRGDVKESFVIIWSMIRGKAEPAHGKFLAEQRLAYAAMGINILVLLFTGLIKTWKNLGDIVLPETFLTVITLIHTAAAMMFLFLFLAHIGAFLIKANWPLFTTMFTGYVNREYAEERHGEWDISGLPVKEDKAEQSE